MQECIERFEYEVDYEGQTRPSQLWNVSWLYRCNECVWPVLTCDLSSRSQQVAGWSHDCSLVIGESFPVEFPQKRPPCPCTLGVAFPKTRAAEPVVTVSLFLPHATGGWLFSLWGDLLIVRATSILLRPFCVDRPLHATKGMDL
jgi:hypothetical protein